MKTLNANWPNAELLECNGDFHFLDNTMIRECNCQKQPVLSKKVLVLA